mgnify:CR=1 FL=1
MSRTYRMSPEARAARAERMKALNADPEFKAQARDWLAFRRIREKFTASSSPLSDAMRLCVRRENYYERRRIG